MKSDQEGYPYKAKSKYRDVRTAEHYDQTRFTGMLGRIKLKRDRDLVSRALREAVPIDCLLDLPCGTGRFTPVLEELAGKVVSADISLEMMNVAASRKARETRARSLISLIRPSKPVNRVWS